MELRQLELPVVEPLASVAGPVRFRQTILVQVVTDEGPGWGECVALHEPTYIADWSDGEFMLLREVLAPLLLRSVDVTPDDVQRMMGHFISHNTSKMALEMAVLDAWLRARGTSWGQHFGATADDVACMIVVGMVPLDALVPTVERHLARGYRNLKFKVQPGSDLDRVGLLRSAFPDLDLRLDANGSYDWADVEHRRALRQIDELGPVLFEQPFRPGRSKPFEELRQSVSMPIGLDESVLSVRRAANAVEQGLCDVITVKPGLIGGYLAVQEVHDLCRDNGVDLAVGGLIETGLARAANLAMAAMPGCANQPAEVTPDGRWFPERITVEPGDMRAGRMAVPQGPGVGVDLDHAALERFTRRAHVVRRGG